LRATALLCSFGAAFGALFAFPAFAQQHREARPPTHTVTEPYHLESFGSFSWLMLRGDFTAIVGLGSALAQHPSTGVGALAGARGEITIYEGKLFLSYGKPGPLLAPEKEKAALLAFATVPAWQSLTIDRDVAPQDVESFIADAAKAHGIDAEKSFPFEMQGSVMPYVMHVDMAPIKGPHGMGLPMAVAVETKGEEIPGKIAALYVTPNLEGIVTRGGQRIEAHWISPDEQWTTRLDHWGIKRGATLLLPKL